jgi:hypothetical protein
MVQVEPNDSRRGPRARISSEIFNSRLEWMEKLRGRFARRSAPQKACYPPCVHSVSQNETYIHPKATG